MWARDIWVPDICGIDSCETDIWGIEICGIDMWGIEELADVLAFARLSDSPMSWACTGFPTRRAAMARVNRMRLMAAVLG